MQRTSTTVKLLVGVAVTTLSGCVSVAGQADAPSRPAAERPAQDLAPQIGRPPVHDSLEAVPAREPSASASARVSGAPPDTRRPAPRPPRQHTYPGTAQHRPRQAPPAVTAPAPPLPAPVTGKDVCALGRGYGKWPAGSPQSRICEETYGH
ncbi:hypothetical protein [Streptomyces sp. NBC_01217]|uniref:hypothetical protein n=1 Tax=Streptomyces sp. NBC_01217 TaxID=2903779 RepID=UPI002E0E3CEA|nr:hypothetical protein OG507_06210 [Streptomyces sp. NBC_01217]